MANPTMEDGEYSDSLASRHLRDLHEFGSLRAQPHRSAKVGRGGNRGRKHSCSGKQEENEKKECSGKQNFPTSVVVPRPRRPEFPSLTLLKQKGIRGRVMDLGVLAANSLGTCKEDFQEHWVETKVSRRNPRLNLVGHKLAITIRCEDEAGEEGKEAEVSVEKAEYYTNTEKRAHTKLGLVLNNEAGMYYRNKNSARRSLYLSFMTGLVAKEKADPARWVAKAFARCDWVGQDGGGEQLDSPPDPNRPLFVEVLKVYGSGCVMVLQRVGGQVWAQYCDDDQWTGRIKGRFVFHLCRDPYLYPQSYDIRQHSAVNRQHGNSKVAATQLVKEEPAPQDLHEGKKAPSCVLGDANAADAYFGFLVRKKLKCSMAPAQKSQTESNIIGGCQYHPAILELRDGRLKRRKINGSLLTPYIQLPNESTLLGADTSVTCDCRVKLEKQSGSD